MMKHLEQKCRNCNYDMYETRYFCHNDMVVTKICGKCRQGNEIVYSDFIKRGLEWFEVREKVALMIEQMSLTGRM